MSPLTSHSKIGPGSSFSAAMNPSTETDAFMTTFPTGFSSVRESLALSVASVRSCKKSIVRQRPAAKCVAGVIAQEPLPDLDVPGRRESGELPELVAEMGLVEVARLSGDLAPVDRCSDVECQHGGGEAIGPSQPFRRDSDDG